MLQPHALCNSVQFGGCVHLAAAANQQPFGRTVIERFAEYFVVQELTENRNRSLSEQIQLMV